MIPSRVIIQCRYNSSRLPGKALLPIHGRPALEICALRAANTGLPVVIATSFERSDDPIAECAARMGILVTRGSLTDVLGRFCLAAEGLADTDTVVRLTADNLFPDGEFLSELLAFYEKSGRDYVGTLSPLDGLPYGLSAEAFSAGILRKAAQSASSKFEREHVTPWIKKTAGAWTGPDTDWLFRPAAAKGDLSALRCTIDTPEDFQKLKPILESEAQLVSASWQKLCGKLSGTEEAPRRFPLTYRNGKPLSRFTLGTAQLGLDYGVTNESGLPSDAEAFSLLAAAAHSGVTSFDCARAYGSAEERLGRFFSARPGAQPSLNLVTKLSPLADLSPSASPEEAAAKTEQSIHTSLRALGLGSPPNVMLHRWSHKRDFAGAVWQKLLQLKENGLIGGLGASVYSVEEAEEALDTAEISSVQLPFNLLDTRWLTHSFQRRREARPEVLIYARSIYLQGALADPGSVKNQAVKDEMAKLVPALENARAHLGKTSLKDLCVAFALGQPWIDSLVIGVETSRQISDNVNLFLTKPLEPDEVDYCRKNITGAPAWLLDPNRWPKN